MFGHTENTGLQTHADSQFGKYTITYFFLECKLIWIIPIKMEANMCRFIYCWFKSALPLDTQEGMVWIPLTGSTLPHCVSILFCDMDFHRHKLWYLFRVQRFEVRGSCSFCWEWWNNWSSLLKLSFHNHTRPNFNTHGIYKL